MARVRELRFNKQESFYCCGLTEIGDLTIRSDWPYSHESEIPRLGALFATTSTGQKHEEVRLKVLGFKRKATWVNSKTKHKVKLWFRAPGRTRKRR